MRAISARGVLMSGVETSMSQESRYFDPEIMNLNGGLFQDALLHTPADFDIVPDRITLTVDETPSAEARKRGRRARMLDWIVAGAAASLVAMGVAAAGEIAMVSAKAPHTAAVQQRNDAANEGHGAPSAPAEAPAPQSASSAAAQASASAPVAATSVVASTPMEAAPSTARPSASPAAASAASSTARPSQAPAAAPASATSASDAASPGALDAFVAPKPFSRSAAAIAIASAARGAGACVAAGEPTTTMPVRVVYSTSGRVTSATLQGGPFMGTAAGSCIANTLKGAKIEAFDGDPTAVTTTIRVH